jgi:dTDP-4-amino-4,6-dideoxygalactose transaminase
LHRPTVTGRELGYLAEAIAARRFEGDGFFTRACARLMEERFGIRRVLMTPSCTAALELAGLVCGIGPGDEVILPSFTFVTTASALVRLGARPVFVDIRADTLNLDEALLEAAVTARTKAIVPVHYGGLGCALGPIMELARRRGLFVIEDAAQGVNAWIGGRALGSIGHLGAYSFHHTKNFTCGEGGALCVNDPELRARAEMLRDKGTNRGAFLRGEASQYTWVDVGSSYVPSELACAFLYAQLEAMDAITAGRRAADALYRARLSALEARGDARLPRSTEGSTPNYHNFYLIVNDPETRDALIGHLRRRGIGAAFHFVPLHTSPVGRRLGYREGDLPLTESLSRRLVRLPLDAETTAREVDLVCAAVERFYALRTGVGPRQAPAAGRLSDEACVTAACS